MQVHTITGGNGTHLNVEETGRRDGAPVLFIHGFSQCHATWRRQMGSDLTQDFRLVAMDLRGHGRSGKPEDAYGNGRLWGDDIHAIIKALDLVRPVLVGWSYGGFVICDYLRYYGDHDIGGINFVGAATKISPETAPEVLGEEFLALLPGFFTNAVDECVATLRDFAGICTNTPPAEHDLYLTLGYNACVPPSVRQALLSRVIDNDDLLPKLRVPVLISHGERDRVVHAQVARKHAAAMPTAALSIYPEAGHAVFLDDEARFNRELGAFVGGLDAATATRSSNVRAV